MYLNINCCVFCPDLIAFFRKTLGEFHFAYSADIYGDGKKFEEAEGTRSESVFSGFNLTFVLGILILAAFWILLWKGVRL